MTDVSSSPRRVALVFGGSRGLGAAIVTRLAADGHDVAFTYVSKPEAAEQLVAAVAADGGRAHAIRADSSDPAEIRAAVAETVQRFGPLRVVVVNAGILIRGTVDTYAVEDLDRMLAINVRGVYLSVQAAAEHLVDGGRVITIGSNTAIRTGEQGMSVYQLTKAALVGLVKGVALDLAPRGITVNNVQPGPHDTDMNAGRLETLAQNVPLGRVGRPAEAAGLVSYLAGDDATFINGASITTDGGAVL